MGSQASGHTKPYSDIDIGVLFSKSLTKAERFAMRIDIITDLTTILKTDSIDLIDLTNASAVLRFEAVKLRKELFIRDEYARIIFETRTLSDYFDGQYYLKRHVHLGVKQLRSEYGIGS